MKENRKPISKSTPGRWTIVLLGAWVIGLAQSSWLTLQETGKPDPYRDIEVYEPIRELVGDALYVGFQTDSDTKKKTHARFWRAQFATTPTILRISYSNKESLTRMSESVETRGFGFLLYEFRNKTNFKDLRIELQDFASQHQCELTTHRIAKRVFLFELGNCQND